MTSEVVMNTLTYLQQKKEKFWDAKTCPHCSCDVENGFQVCSGVGKGYSGSCPQGPKCNIQMHVECAKVVANANNQCPGCQSDIIINFSKYTPGSLDYLREWNDSRMKALNIDQSSFFYRSGRR
jgi:hypothetical protein